MAVGRKTGGRAQGTRNKLTVARSEELKEALSSLSFAEQSAHQEFSIIEACSRLLNSDDTPPAVKLDLIKSLLPYAFKKLPEGEVAPAQESRVVRLIVEEGISLHYH